MLRSRIGRVLVIVALLGTGWLLCGDRALALQGGHDVRLDEALAALQKAAALVEESSTGGGVSPRTQHQFDRHVERALADIQEAMDHVMAAAAATDADSSAY